MHKICVMVIFDFIYIRHSYKIFAILKFSYIYFATDCCESYSLSTAVYIFSPMPTSLLQLEPFSHRSIDILFCCSLLSKISSSLVQEVRCLVDCWTSLTGTCPTLQMSSNVLDIVLTYVIDIVHLETEQ